MAIIYPQTIEECRFFTEWHVNNAWDTYIKRNEDRDENTIRKCVKQGTLGELMFSAINGGIFPVKLNRNGDNGIDTSNAILGNIQLKTTSDSRYVYDDGYRKEDFPHADYCYVVVGYHNAITDSFDFYYDLPSNVMTKWKQLELEHRKSTLVLDKNDLIPWKSIDEAYRRYGKIQSIHPENDISFNEE